MRQIGRIANKKEPTVTGSVLNGAAKTSSCISFRTLVTSSMDSTEDLNRIAVVDEQVEDVEERKEYPWKRSKKMAAMLSFSGKNYYGMQRNPGPDINTIEDELLKALAKSGAIDPEWETNPQKAFFTRASRTDKGVSAARMVVSLKMILDPPSLEDINNHLPSDIRLQNVVRATKNFNCQSSADARTYLYLLPTFAFAPVEEVVTEAWRCKPDTIGKVNEVLNCYVGSHFFHNYTSAKLPMEPSSRRFMQEVEAGQPFEKHGLEWSVLRVKGQSFMLHQIRKMIGLALAIVRGHTSLVTLETAWGGERIDIPRAPGLGLMLDTIHYERYNKRYGEDGQHDRLDWAGQHDEVEKFKEDFIFGDIMKTEIEEKSMLLWLGQVRYLQNECLLKEFLLKGFLLQGILLQGILLQGILLQGILLPGILLKGFLLQGFLLKGFKVLSTTIGAPASHFHSAAL